MNRTRKYVIALVGLGALGLLARTVYAHCGRCADSCKEMVSAMDTGKVTLNKAIEAAEAASKGKACAALCHMDGGKLGFAVYCLAGDKLVEIPVDDTGKAGEAKDCKQIPAHEKGAAAAPPKKEEKKEEKKPGSPG